MEDFYDDNFTIILTSEQHNNILIGSYIYLIGIMFFLSFSLYLLNKYLEIQFIRYRNNTRELLYTINKRFEICSNHLIYEEDYKTINRDLQNSILSSSSESETSSDDEISVGESASECSSESASDDGGEGNELCNSSDSVCSISKHTLNKLG